MKITMRWGNLEWNWAIHDNEMIIHLELKRWDGQPHPFFIHSRRIDYIDSDGTFLLHLKQHADDRVYSNCINGINSI
jgi:hypothetical protein